jgi:hypothetical protein
MGNWEDAGETEESGDVPDGAAVLPEFPAELNAHPLLLAVLHAVVFLGGSNEEVVHPEAANEALSGMAAYLQRLSGPDLDRVRADLHSLEAYARKEKWGKAEVQFLKQFLNDFSVDG